MLCSTVYATITSQALSVETSGGAGTEIGNSEGQRSSQFESLFLHGHGCRPALPGFGGLQGESSEMFHGHSTPENSPENTRYDS